MRDRLGRPAPQDLRSLSAPDRHRALSPPRAPGDVPGALPIGAPRVLGARQRLVASRRALRERLTRAWPRITVVHTPVHASWLNQVEIYFSIVQRKVLRPNDLNSLTQLRDHLLRFQGYYEEVAQPFQWKFTRRDLGRLMTKLSVHETGQRWAA